MNSFMQLPQLLLASAFALTLRGSANAQSTPTGVKNIVLVHGAFADGSSWSKVIDNCRQRVTMLSLFKIHSRPSPMMLLQPSELSLKWTDQYFWWDTPTEEW